MAIQTVSPNAAVQTITQFQQQVPTERSRGNTEQRGEDRVTVSQAAKELSARRTTEINQQRETNSATEPPPTGNTPNGGGTVQGNSSNQEVQSRDVAQIVQTNMREQAGNTTQARMNGNRISAMV